MDVNTLLPYVSYAVPVGIILISVVLVYVVGFKKAEQPPFAHLSGVVDADAKNKSKKKSKNKDKKAANGQVAIEKSSPKKSSTKSETSSKKSDKSDENSKPKEKKQDDNKISNNKKASESKVGKENKVEQTKNKKNLKNLLQEKPVDYDEGDWVLAYSRKDKLQKKREEETTPSKKSKKTKKGDNEVTINKDQKKSGIKDKVAKETQNKELKEKDSAEITLTPISNEEPEKEIEKAEELTKESPKVEKVEKEDKKSGKGKKAKKNTDSEPAKQAADAKQDKKTKEISVEQKVPEVAAKADSVKPVESEPSEEKGVAVFDELGDVWKEAKPPKKSKKKSRKDN